MRNLSVLLAAALATAPSLAVRAEEKSKADVSQAELKAKIDYCKTCHGLSGSGIPWIVSDAAAGRTATRISRKSAAGIHRAAGATTP